MCHTSVLVWGVIGGGGRKEGGGGDAAHNKQKMPENTVEDSHNNLPCREQKVRGRKLITGHLQEEAALFLAPVKNKVGELDRKRKTSRKTRRRHIHQKHWFSSLAKTQCSNLSSC